MVIKKCCVAKCKSKSTRKEDVRVTYHKFPKEVSMRDAWVQVTRHASIELNTYVCSRHFLLTDFQHTQGRYVLKSGAVPSIFPWTNMDELDTFISTDNQGDDKKNLSSSSKESEPENLEAIKDFLAKHDKKESALTKEVIQNESEKTDDSKTEIDESTTDSSIPSSKDEPLVIANSVMDFILNESADKLSKNNESNTETPSTNDKGVNSVALSVGSKVEARDFAESWYSAEIVEVDYDEMEVLVRFESDTKKSEEWISVNSPRLRPVTGDITSAEMKPVLFVNDENNVTMKKVKVTQSDDLLPVKEEEKVDIKAKMAFTVGERCLARWRDNRRFVATIQNDLGNGTFEIMFDDGFHWKCSVNRLSKLKESSKVDSPFDSRVCSTPSPTPGAGPSTSAGVPETAFHKHLFDPTRDYLGSKSERRELKRKLNIKEIFNIGQKQRKKEPQIKEEKQKILKEKMPRSHKKTTNVELKREIKIEKKDIPDAIASIIGTVSNNREKVSIKKEVITKIKKEKTNEGLHKNSKKEIFGLSEDQDPKSKESQPDRKINKDDNVEQSNVPFVSQPKDELSDEDTQSAKMSDSEMDTNDDVDTSGDQDAKLSDDQDRNMSIDRIQEEDRLQSFEKPDDVKHEQVIDRIKEAINKLEDGLNKELNNDTPKVENKIEPDKPAEICLDIKQEEKGIEQENNEVEQEANKVEKEKKEAKQENEEVKQEICETKEELCETKEEENETNPEKTTKIKIKLKKKSKKLLKYEKRIKALEQEKAGAIELFSSRLESMKKEMDEIRMIFEKKAPESFLLEGEWCCKWVDGEPVGTVVETDPDNRNDVLNRIALPRKTVQVEDKRLPEGWSKLMVRRSFGHSAGKWDVVLVSPDKRRFHTKTDMRHYLELCAEPALRAHEAALMDFAVHLKLARRLGWVTGAPSRPQPTHPPPHPHPHASHKRKRLLLKRGGHERKVKKRKMSADGRYKFEHSSMAGSSAATLLDSSGHMSFNNSTLEDGYVYVGSLKVQVIDNLLRCPADGCFKNFRNNTLLQMHIKHYHRELRKSLGTTPKVLDLAYARTVPTETETKPRYEPDNKIIKVKIPRPPKRIDESKLDMKEVNIEPRGEVDVPMLPKIPRADPPVKIPRSLDSPIMRQLSMQSTNRPVKRPKVLLPVRRPDPIEPPPELGSMDELSDFPFDNSQLEPRILVPPLEILDFETAISTHTVSKPSETRRRPEQRKVFATISKAPLSDDEDTTGMNSDVETRSSYPGSGTPDSKTMEPKASVQNIPMSSESNEDSTTYMYTESGERIKLERMKREEIINCHCGFREEDGLMVQCELCLCWQHALCHNIQREADVPQKYTCSICLSPRRGRRSRRFLHDQDRMHEGLLPGGRASEPLRRSHDISANLLGIADALHALRLKYYVATKKNHPKLYLWAKDWDGPEVAFAQEKQNAYSDLNVIINNMSNMNNMGNMSNIGNMSNMGNMSNIGNMSNMGNMSNIGNMSNMGNMSNIGSISNIGNMSNAGVQSARSRGDDSSRADMHTPTEDQEDRLSQNGSLSNHSLLGGLLASPGGPSLEMPISTTELERLAKTVQEQAEARPAVAAPQPEAAIENGACRERLLRHVRRCQALIDARLDTLEAEIVELEAQEPSFEDDETADYFPRTKQTVQMLMRDLQSLQQLGLIT